jgi:hypothetical protein
MLKDLGKTIDFPWKDLYTGIVALFTGHVSFSHYTLPE